MNADGTTVPAPLPPATAAGGDGALLTFAAYLVVVFVLAGLAHRTRSRSSFIADYFLGGRALGPWALALTFAATTASGGTFIGFPSLVYTHGWSLALWIASYMMVPLVAMAMLGKRLNVVARRARAVTVPELLEERFASRHVGTTATALVVVFMFFYLLAQFKAGSKILSTLLAGSPVFQAGVTATAAATRDLPWLGGADPDYLLCLAVFAVAVIAYVVYGGFRAVVWTDVLQGVVMFAGVVVLLALVLHQTGGLAAATSRLAATTPPEFAAATLHTTTPPPTTTTVPKNTWLLNQHGAWCKTTAATTIPAGSTTSPPVESLVLTSGERPLAATTPTGLTAETAPPHTTFSPSNPGTYTSLPGPAKNSDLGFLSVGMAFSFFVFWAFGTAAQPGNLVRLMAFDKTATLRRAVVTVSLYFSVIYFFIVVVFCCGRTLVPGLEDDPDRIMPELTAVLTANAGVPWLAGLLLAAPFAAVMSSVDSFLLIVSSSVVRDIYQRRINPSASQRRVRTLAHTVTALAGTAAVLAVVNPPERLQDLIVFASGGLAGCFLVPVTLALFWKRANAPGMVAGMLGGFATHAALTLYGFATTGGFAAPNLLDLQPFVWDLAGSAAAAVAATLATRPPPHDIQLKFFTPPPP